MVPMIDTMMAPGTIDAIVIVGPGFVGVLVAVVGGAAWIARGVAEELRRTAARDCERTIAIHPLTTGGSPPDRADDADGRRLRHTRRDIRDREHRSSQMESYAALLARLSRLSVTKHFDAYADVDWEAPSIDADDPRWELRADRSAAGGDRRYRALPQPARARLGLHLIATQVKLGVEFERVLKQGLLEFAATLPHDAPEFRYAYHEVIEEAQHSLMFQEFARAHRARGAGLGWLDPPRARAGSRAGVGRFPSSSSCSSSVARSRSTTCSARRYAAVATSIRSCER